MNDLIDSGAGGSAPVTMTSREIAELTGKQHQHVRRDVETMLTALGLNPSSFGRIYRDSLNREKSEYVLPKRETMILVSGYDVHLRARVVDRVAELEARLAAAPIQLSRMDLIQLALAAESEAQAEREQRIQLEGQVEEMRPQVQALERIALSDGSLCITDAAKTLQIRPKDLFAHMRAHHWIYGRQGSAGEVAYQAKLQMGLLEHKTTTVNRTDGSEKTVTRVRVTPKGLIRLARELGIPCAEPNAA